MAPRPSPGRGDAVPQQRRILHDASANARRDERLPERRSALRSGGAQTGTREGHLTFPEMDEERNYVVHPSWHRQLNAGSFYQIAGYYHILAQLREGLTVF